MDKMCFHTMGICSSLANSRSAVPTNRCLALHIIPHCGERNSPTWPGSPWWEVFRGQQAVKKSLGEELSAQAWQELAPIMLESEPHLFQHSTNSSAVSRVQGLWGLGNIPWETNMCTLILLSGSTHNFSWVWKEQVFSFVLKSPWTSMLLFSELTKKLVLYTQYSWMDIHCMII